MPIRPEFRTLYPPNWRALSDEIRFTVAGGRCQRCDRPHGATLKVLQDGRWFDPARNTRRNERGREARWPDIEEAIGWRMTKVVLATAHLDGNPRNNNRRRNLRALYINAPRAQESAARAGNDSAGWKLQRARQTAAPPPSPRIARPTS